MPRQLNKELFEEQLSAQSFKTSKNNSPELLVQDNSYKIKMLERKITELNNQLHKLELRTPQLESLYKKLFEKNQNNIKRLEAAVKSNLQNVFNKFSRLSSKMNQKTLEQSRVKELIDRQNSILQQYELRMSKMQKILSEQELQLMNYKSTLKQLQKKHYL